ncbi:MAG: PAS domain S-box protein [bacterium]|nr:PAS domain S-box protein [bacterium]
MNEFDAFGKMFMNNPIPTLVGELRDGDIRVIDINDAARKLADGYLNNKVNLPVKEILGENHYIFTTALDCIRNKKNYIDERMFIDPITHRRLYVKVTYTYIPDNYVMFFFEDKTKQVEMQKALEESETMYRRIVEDQTEFICKFLSDCTITFANDVFARYLNVAREDLIGKNYLDFIPENDRHIMLQNIDQAKEETPVRNYTHTILKEDGHRWIERTDRLIHKNGEIIVFQSIARDITKQKELEEQLKLIARERMIEKLTRTERIVFDKYGAGKNQVAIAGEMEVEEGTINKHISNMKRKLGIKSTRNLIKLAMEIVDQG